MVNYSDFETAVGTMDVYARSASASYKIPPASLEQENGVKPLDRLPAQWWNWFLGEATSRFAEYKTYISNALGELDNILDVVGVTPDGTVSNQLKIMFQNTYLGSYLPSVISGATDFSSDAAKDAYVMVAEDDNNSNYAVKKVPYAPSVFICTDPITNNKTVTLPANCPYTGQAVKVVFTNGHKCADAATPMTLNGTPVVVNKEGTLVDLQIYTDTSGGGTTYKSLDPNTTLDMYYTANYNGNNNPAWVIIGNPVVLQSSDYTIYANGRIEYLAYKEKQIAKTTLFENQNVKCYAKGKNICVIGTVKTTGVSFNINNPTKVATGMPQPAFGTVFITSGMVSAGYSDILPFIIEVMGNDLFIVRNYAEDATAQDFGHGFYFEYVSA